MILFSPVAVLTQRMLKFSSVLLNKVRTRDWLLISSNRWRSFP